MNLKKNNENKKKHSLLKTFGQLVILLVVFIVLTEIVTIIEGITKSNGVVRHLTDAFVYMGLVGFVLTFIKNYSDKKLFKICYSVYYAVIGVAVVIAIVCSVINNNYNKESICEGDGDELYYCSTDEPITCEGDDEIAVQLDQYSYKCYSPDEYRHEVKKQEYDFTCTKKFSFDTFNNELPASEIKELVLAEKSCLEKTILSKMKTYTKTKSKGLESSFDIRNKVKVKAGNQGNSDTCEIWSSTKALEISAQLKGLDYQYLIEFESKINDLDANINGTVSGDSTSITIGSDHMIPGKKKYTYFTELALEDGVIEIKENGKKKRIYSNDNSNNDDSRKVHVFSTELEEYIDQYYDIYMKAYPDKTSFNISDAITDFKEYYKQLYISVTKQLIKENGSVFISTIEEIQPGHRMVIIGWDDSKEAWLVLNSWGDTWSKDDHVPTSNGDGTTWIKYNDSNFKIGSANFSGGDSIELIGK